MCRVVSIMPCDVKVAFFLHERLLLGYSNVGFWSLQATDKQGILLSCSLVRSTVFLDLHEAHAFQACLFSSRTCF